MPIRSQESWIHRFSQMGAFWVHDGNTLRPHAELTSGDHSSGFFNGELVMEDPRLLDEVCFDLLHRLIKVGFDPVHTDRVVGPAMGAITMAHDLARHLATYCYRTCKRGYTEKDTADGEKQMLFKRTKVARDERILLVEDTLTTGSSVELTSLAVVRAGGTTFPYVAVICNRSGLKEVGGKRIVACIEKEMQTWKPAECPLCLRGSTALRPKDKENWARLNASY